MNLFSSALQPEFKMVFVVNTQLEMGRGKQCAQVAHAAVTLAVEMMTSRNEEQNLRLNLWLAAGQKKIVLKGDSLEKMMQIQEQASAFGLPNHLISDAGHTQIAPGSKTVLAVFGTEQELQGITGELKLL